MEMYAMEVARKPTATSDREVEAVVTAPDYGASRAWAQEIETAGREAWIGTSERVVSGYLASRDPRF